MRSFTYDALPGRVRLARGLAASSIAEELAALDARRTLVVTEASQRDLADRLTRGVSARIADVFDAVAPHVPEEVAVAARERAAAVRADLVLSIGGGSTTGTAKAIALTDRLPIVAVPTTYAGSEVTPVWGITSQGEKRTGRAMQVLPRVVIYDPELADSLPPEMAVASALNAMAHCVESLWAPGTNPVIAALALEGARVLADGLRGLSNAAENVADDLLYGSYLAGASFAVAGSGLHHKICHALGGAFGLPHAGTHAVVLPHVLAYNLDTAPRLMRRLAVALGNREDHDALQALRGIYAVADAPTSLMDVGLAPDQRDEAIRSVAQLLPIPNPRPVSQADLASIIDSAMTGGTR